MLPSLIHSMERVAITNSARSSSIIARHLSSSTTTTTSIPTIGKVNKNASPDQLKDAKDLLTPRLHPQKSSVPTYRGIPTKMQNERSPTETPNGLTLYPSKHRYDTGVTPEEMPFLHHIGHDDKPKPKFKSPRRRASKLYNELMTEKIAEGKASKPAVWDVPFKIGDSVELEVVDDGGVDNADENKRLDVIRGVVLGRHKRGLDEAIYIKDVLYGEHVERKVKLHSPLVKTLKVLEEGFINKGKRKGRKIKRAKLYYLRERGMEGEYILFHYRVLSTPRLFVLC